MSEHDQTASRRRLLKLSLLASAGIAGGPVAQAADCICSKPQSDGTPAQFLPKTASDATPQDDDLGKYPICPYCGMDRRYFHKSRMLIHYAGEVPDPLCSLHCAVISLALNLSLDPKAIYVADNAALVTPYPLIDAEKASFLVGSGLPGVMTGKSKVAYGSRQAAMRAQEMHGGELLDLAQTLRTAFADLADDMDSMRRAREERRKRANQRQPG